MNNLSDKDLPKLLKAINLIQGKIKWKPNKAQSHLLKRIKLGHLPSNSSLKTYEEIINTIIFNPEAQVYVFQAEDSLYPIPLLWFF
jgi:hypothetical protein